MGADESKEREITPEEINDELGDEQTPDWMGDQGFDGLRMLDEEPDKINRRHALHYIRMMKDIVFQYDEETKKWSLNRESQVFKMWHDSQGNTVHLYLSICNIMSIFHRLCSDTIDI